MPFYKLPKIIGWDKKPTFGARLNPHHPLSQGLVGAWLFNEGVGNNISDLALNKNHGVLTSVDWSGNTLFFNADADKILINSNPSLNLLQNWTYSIFVNRTSGCTLFSHWDSTVGGRQIQIQLAAKIYVAIPYIVELGYGTNNVVYGAWTMITITKYGTSYAYYIDGTLDATKTKANAQEAATTSLSIGRDPVDLTGSRGLFNLPLIWNRALSQGEIYSLYVNPYQIFLPVVWDAYYVTAAAPPPTGGKSIFGYDSIFHAGGIIQT